MRATFGPARQTLGHPVTTRLLNQLWPDVVPTPDPVNVPGPRPCCAEYGSVERCDGTTDVLRCPVCETQWTRRCVGDDVPAVEV